MGKMLNYKLLTIALLVLLLWIPLLMIRGVISERTHYRDEVRQDIARSWTGAQKLLGPLLVIPYSEATTRRVWDENLKKYRTENYTRETALYLLPDELNVTARVSTELRSRGLYSLPVYSSELHLAGLFDTAPLKALLAGKGRELKFGEPFVAVAVNDIRGLVVQPTLSWNGEKSRFVAGSGMSKLQGGIHAPITLAANGSEARYPFSFDMSLHGMETLELSPVGNTTQVTMRADWPHPSFIGRYLPEGHEITGDAFTAQWRISSISSDMQRLVTACASGNCQEFSNNTFGVSLINPVDIYQQAERAVKYGLMFVLLTFVAFFLFEMMKPLRLHPMQYLLVGMALSIFYLLLISLSEHMVFAWAYLSAAVASTALIGVYVSSVLGGVWRGTLLSGGLLLLYAMLYAILQSEDNALLMGSMLLFVVLACVMMVTRKLDWYRLGNPPQPVAEVSQP